MNSLVDKFSKFSPQILTLIFLGYAPFFGESFRLYFKNPSGFILLASILALVYWRQFKNFIFEKNITQFWWLLIIFYCVLITTLPHLGKYSLYVLYLDLGTFFVMLFGIFFGKKIASQVSMKQLFAIMTLILILLAIKLLWMYFHETPALNDGLGFFIGSASYDGIPKIILRGENPFITSMFILTLGLLLLPRNNAATTIGLALSFLLTMALIVIAGVRSIYFGIIPGCIFLGFFLPQKNLKKNIFIGILLGIFFFSLYLFIGRDAMLQNPADSFQAYPGMSILGEKSWWFINESAVDKLASDQIPLLNSMSIVIRLAEYLDVVNCVNDHWPTGLGMGALCFNPATQNLGSYIHSQPFWLYLKGGFILVILFYSFMVYVIYRDFKYRTQDDGYIICSAALIALCSLDFLTNQFPTLSGSFFLGFWVGYHPPSNLEESFSLDCDR